jgi:hypothetical protein
MEIEHTALGADAIHIELMLFCLIATAIREGEAIISQTITIGRSGCINPTRAEWSGNGVGICANPLNPADTTLVVVQLIAYLTVSKVG